MKIRIEGCTPEELRQYSPYLTVGTIYSVDEIDGDLVSFKGDGELEVAELLSKATHLPKGARWVEVPCCEPSAEDLKLIADGDYCAEELWGGPRPTCSKCIDK